MKAFFSDIENVVLFGVLAVVGDLIVVAAVASFL